MLKKAKESGAEAVDPSSRPSGSSGGASAFVGSGFKLGSSETAPSEMVAGASKPSAPKTFIIKVGGLCLNIASSAFQFDRQCEVKMANDLNFRCGKMDLVLTMTAN